MQDGALRQDDPLRGAKAALRAEARRRRDALSPDVRAAASQALVGQVMAHLPALAGDMAGSGHRAPVISAYWPIHSELDPLPLLAALAEAGVATSLPVVAHPSLIFRLWRPGDELVDAGFGTRGPAAHAEVCAPTVVLTPCLAFDRAGGRLGYGAGHFDRALQRLRNAAPTRAVAVAFAAQEAASTFSEPHDQPLDAIVTEQGVIFPAAP